MAELLYDNRPKVFNIIKKKCNYATIEEIEDAYSITSVKLLKNHKKLHEGDIFHASIKETFDALGRAFNESWKFNRYVVEGRRHYDSIDFNKLDPRFRNSLTPIQQKVFEERCTGVKGYSKTKSKCYVVTTAFYIIRKYRKWIVRVKGVTQDKIDKLSRKNFREVMTLVNQGYSNIEIGKRMNMSLGHVSVAICLSRRLMGLSKSINN